MKKSNRTNVGWEDSLCLRKLLQAGCSHLTLNLLHLIFFFFLWYPVNDTMSVWLIKQLCSLSWGRDRWKTQAQGLPEVMDMVLWCAGWSQSCLFKVWLVRFAFFKMCYKFTDLGSIFGGFCCIETEWVNVFWGTKHAKHKHVQAKQLYNFCRIRTN